MAESKRVKFEFDERSVKTLEQMIEEGYVSEGGVLKMPEPVSVFGCAGDSPADRLAARTYREARIEMLERKVAEMHGHAEGRNDVIRQLEAELARLRPVFAAAVGRHKALHAPYSDMPSHPAGQALRDADAALEGAILSLGRKAVADAG